ncbi:cilia- and flagella-associated protein 45-like [Nicotiana sylvestris]|uniref:cilia- and flagella-associated protein 45-like n=1 Tax=Nicotiana sylvestris TaxID=4096 RepID=UPI00388CE981
MASKRDTLRKDLASTQSLLQSAKEEAHKLKALHTESSFALSMARSDADVLILSYREDVAAANTQAREISEEDELKLARALAHAQLEARRQAFEEVYVKGFDLYAEIEEVKALEEESAALTTSDEGSASISEFSEVRPSPLEEEEGHSISETEKRKTEKLEHLRGEANQVNSECNDLKAQIDAHVAAKRNALVKASTLEIQLFNARESNLVQASRVAKLEIDLLKMKAEVVDARAEAEDVRAKADKKVAIYLKDDVEARTKLREASDRERRSNEYA